MITKNELFTPNDFAEKIKIIETKVLSYNKHHIPDYSTGNTIMNQYDNVLSSLAIARYSYAYWYDVATNVDNPLHGGFGNTPTYKCFPPLKKLWNAIVGVVEEVTKEVADVAVAAWADISSGEVATYHNNDILLESGVSITWKLDAAGDASSKAYNDRKNNDNK